MGVFCFNLSLFTVFICMLISIIFNMINDTETVLQKLSQEDYNLFKKLS